MFILMHEYDRVELLKFVGSKQGQSGIIWGPKDTTCVIVTSGGRGGKRAGYGDIRNNDGTILYIGQGEKGDQDPSTFANALLVKGERSVLFFSTREPNAKEVRLQGNHKKLYKFEGIYQVVSWDFIVPSTGKRAKDKLLQFYLVPANNIFDLSPTTIDKPSLQGKEVPSLADLKKKLKSNNNKPTKGKSNIKDYFIRSQEIITYAKIRANGVCEMCEKPAPFNDIYNLPFLEVHHIFRLADDGPDSPENVAAVCPNCHRESHYGKEKNGIKEYLEKIILAKEALISEH